MKPILVQIASNVASKKQHKQRCGCYSARFIKHAVQNCLDKAYIDHEMCSKHMNWLGKYHAHNIPL